jgi:hypothetical protein
LRRRSILKIVGAIYHRFRRVIFLAIYIPVKHEYKYIYPDYEFMDYFSSLFHFTKEKFGSLSSAIKEMEAAKPNIQELRNNK